MGRAIIRTKLAGVHSNHTVSSQPGTVTVRQAVVFTPVKTIEGRSVNLVMSQLEALVLAMTILGEVPAVKLAGAAKRLKAFAKIAEVAYEKEAAER